MRQTLFLLIALAAISLRAPCVRAADTPARPNIVIFLADDQGWGDLSVNGNTMLQTPHIDSLARDGVTLDRFFVCPVCAPTRAELFTGRYHPRTGVRGVSTGLERLNTDEKTIADAFRAAGYATGAFGKWHNGSQWPYHPNARGFTEYYGFTSGHWGEYFAAPLEHNGQAVRGHGFIADDFTDHALAFIEANQKRPFFCYVPFNTPHSPFCAPQSSWSKHKDQPISQRGPDGDRETIDVTRAVLAMNENLDSNVGRVLARLDDLKLRDRTIVVYFSDNGPNSYRFNGGMKGRKGSTDEGGVRSTCLIRWPQRFPAGRTMREIAGAIDLLPTLTAAAGVARVGDKPLDGRDMGPLLSGAASQWPARMIFSHQNGKVSVRTQQYRLDDQGKLFDMLADPGQTKDVNAKQPEVVQMLSSAVADWKRDVLPKAKDDRPYPVGYAEFPRTWLPARDGIASGGVQRSAGAPNCSYYVNWTTTAGRMTWDVEVATSGKYQVEIYYACPTGNAGSEIQLTHAAAQLAGKVTPDWDPALITDQDVIPRPKGESIMKDFRPLNLGTINLTQGRAPLVLEALSVKNKEVMQVRGIALTLLKTE